MVRDGLFGQNETIGRQRSADIQDRGEERRCGEHIRAIDDRQSRARDSGTSPCDRAVKHPFKPCINRLNEHNNEYAFVFRCQVGSGDEEG